MQPNAEHCARSRFIAKIEALDRQQMRRIIGLQAGLELSAHAGGARIVPIVRRTRSGGALGSGPAVSDRRGGVRCRESGDRGRWRGREAGCGPLASSRGIETTGPLRSGSGGCGWVLRRRGRSVLDVERGTDVVPRSGDHERCAHGASDAAAATDDLPQFLLRNSEADEDATTALAGLHLDTCRIITRFVAR